MQKKEIYSKKYIFLKEIQNITIFVIVTFKVPYKFICLGLVERAKFQIVIFLPIMADAALRHCRYYCIFGPFNKNPSALKKFEKLSSQQLLLQVLLISNVNLWQFYNLHLSFSYNLNSLIISPCLIKYLCVFKKQK